MAGLIDQLEGDPDVDALLGDDALVRALLDVEAALARACSRAGLVPAEAAAAIDDTAAALHPDPADLGRRARAAGNPVVPLVADLLAAVPEVAAPWVHVGATSQDVLDTALMLLASRSLRPILDRLEAAADAAATLARAHRGTLMVARTLGQQAMPTTFGLKAAGWSAAMRTAQVRLAHVHDHGLAVQLGGAVGTLAGLGERGPQVADLLAAELGLAPAPTPWHTERSRVQALAGVLAGAVTTTGKIGADVVLLAQGEVAEVSEGGAAGHGGSSAMPHKRNPVDAVLLVAAARRAPTQLGAVLVAGVHEHERATGSWHAEWQPLLDLLHLAGGAAARAHTLLAGLQVHPEAMRATLDAAGPALLTESLVGRLSPQLGRARARAVVLAALDSARGQDRDVQEVLRASEVGRVLGAEALAAALDPAGYLGATDVLVDRLLATDALTVTW